jgi:hypothetical protein
VPLESLKKAWRMLGDAQNVLQRRINAEAATLKPQR